MSSGRFVIRAAVARDYEQLKAVWFDAFPPDFFGGEANVDAHFQWAFGDNPHLREGDVTQWVGELDGDLVAVWSTAPAELMIDGKPQRAVWLQNTAVAKRGQRKGLGKQMFCHILSHVPLALGIGVMEGSRALYASAGVAWVPADTLGTLQLPGLHFFRMAAGLVRRGRLRAALGLLLPRMRSQLGARGTPLEAVPTKEFDQRVDAFAAALAKDIPALPVRNAKVLNWLMAGPRLETSAFTVSWGGTMRGYVVVRHDGYILDLLVKPGDHDAFAALVMRVQRWAKKRGIRQLSGIMPGLAGLSELYRQAGFLPSIETFGLFYAFADLNKRHPTLDDPRNWYVSMADSDVFTFRLG